MVTVLLFGEMPDVFEVAEPFCISTKGSDFSTSLPIHVIFIAFIYFNFSFCLFMCVCKVGVYILGTSPVIRGHFPSSTI